MSFTYLDKMRLTEHFLSSLKLRLTDKTSVVLPDEGVLYATTNPATKSLLGGIGPQPDPDFTGPQPPSAIGMVLMVVPDEHGLVTCKVSGQFDVAHRYIPDLELMRQNIIPETSGPKISQQIALSFRRYTISFTDVPLDFVSTDAIHWVHDESVIKDTLKQWEARWLADPRVFRQCHTTDKGGAKYHFTWNDALMDSQERFDKIIYAEIFADPNKVLPYAVKLRGRLRPAPASFGQPKNTFLLELYLENDIFTETARAYGVDLPFLLDAGFTARLEKGTHLRVPHRLQPEDYRFIEEDGVAGYGITCAVNQLSSTTFATNSLPTTAQPRVEAPTAEEVGMLERPTYFALAADPIPVIDSFLIALRDYGKEWAARVDAFDPLTQADEITAATGDRKSFDKELSRIEDGIALIRQHAPLRQSFQWMNDAMDRAIRLQKKSFDGWHLFQLGFILTQVRAIYERHAPASEVTGVAETADVLWFATGGGKTEAYLGIIAMSMLYGRKVGRLYGTSAWMRFPLRMLSVQQFQRLSYVVAQANMIRQTEGLGGHPFTIGYFTGGGIPNSISSTYDNDIRNFLPALSEDQLAAYQFISDCPYCGTERSVKLDRHYEHARLKHVCGNTACWSNSQADTGEHGEGVRGEIGIYVSGEECYRYLPTVMVGTIDKLAVIAFNKRFAAFFGTSNVFCPEHGFTEEWKCGHNRIVKTTDGGYEAKLCGNHSKTSPIRTVVVKPLLDPGFPLLIQDELHLLRESLGNFDAHYETLLAALQVAHGGQTPKVLAATATIKNFEAHIHNLYLRQACRFPAPGATRGESFYARRKVDPESGTPLVRRWYAGILPIGRGNAAMRGVAEISSRFLDQVDAWRELLRQNDPVLLGALGFDVGKAPLALTYIERNLNTDLVYVNKKRAIMEILRFMEEANATRGVDRHHFQLDGESTLDAILGAIHHIERKAPDDSRRHILATSVVSHGVDIAELNFMVLAGWPASTSEYIQASARSGRVHPGIVMSVLASNKLFESNVFLNFDDYHFFMEKLVESVPINRFAPNILDRTLPGVMSAVILNWARHQHGWGKGLDRYIKSLHKELNTAGSPARTEILRVVMAALTVPVHLRPEFDVRVLTNFASSLDDKVKGALHRLENWSAAKMERSINEALGDYFEHEPLRSFRDIENQIQIKFVSESTERVLDALGR